MRRRQVRFVHSEPEQHTLLFVAAGAVAGAAAGMFLGRRYRTVDAFVEDMRGRLDDLRLAWQEEAEDDRVHLASVADRVDEAVDDEEEGDWIEEYDDVGARIDDDLVDDIEAELDDEDLDDDDLDDEDLDDELDETVLANGAEPAAAAARALLEQDVLEALHDDRRLRSRAIEIAVVGDGVVELTGSVHAIEEISRAAAVVRKVPGVGMVLNRIEVRSAGHVDTASVPRDPAAPDGGEAGPKPA
jgi:hypothetical protein